MNGVKLSISMDEKQVDRFIRLLTTEYSNMTWYELGHSLIDAGLLVLEKGGDKPEIRINSHSDKLLDDYMYRKMAQPMTLTYTVKKWAGYGPVAVPVHKMKAKPRIRGKQITLDNWM